MPDVLHLYGNWKWTGPTELAVHLAESQAKAGARVRFAFGRPRGNDLHFERQIAARGVERLHGFELAKHFEPTSLLRDAWRLSRVLRTEPPGVVHCHLRSDHVVATMARRMAGAPVRIVRSTYEPSGPGDGVRERWCLKRGTDRLLVPTEGAKRAVASAGLFDPARTDVVEPAIDTVRFDPSRDVGDGRTKLGIAPGAFVLGIVARVQRRRRYDVFLEAARRLCARDPAARIVVLGGGTHLDEVARRPAAEMGIGDRVIFPGVLRADEYVAALRTLDVKVYLVPGTDGTCRAVKEAMCVGVPVVASREGMLPDLVRDGETGLLFDGDADSLDAAVERLRGDAALRARMGAVAAREAKARWSREPMRRRIDEIYASLCRSDGAARPTVA